MADTTSISIYDEIEKAIITYFNTNWTFTSVQYPNILFDPESLTSWVQIHIVPTIKRRLCLTGNKKTGLWTRGTVVINIYTRSNTGTGVIKSYVTKACSLFNYAELTITTGQILSFGVSQCNPPSTEGLWYKETVTCDFDILV